MNRLQSTLLAVLCLAGPTFAGGSAPPESPVPMTLARQKSNGSGVNVRYRVEAAPQVGRAVSITLAFSGVGEVTAATARFTSDAELTLDPLASGPVELPRGDSSYTVRATPSREGRFYLNVFTTQRGAKSVISIPVQVGEPRAKAQGGEAPDEPGAIVMPVE